MELIAPGGLALAFLMYVLYILVILAFVRLGAWIFARAFRVKERIELMEEQNELLREIRGKMGKDIM